jgi:preprotein translocase subunit YajC
MTSLLFSFAVILAQAVPAPTGTPPNPILGSLPMIIGMIVIFYFIGIRPQQKQRKELQTMIGSLKTNDRIVTNGGIHGVVTGIKDRTLSVRVAEGVKIEIEKSAVVTVSRKEGADEPAAA